MNTSKFVAPNTVFDSSVSFLRNVTFDSSVYLQGVTHISNPGLLTSNTPYALVVGTIGTDVSIQARQLGTMAWETSTNYYSKPEADVINAAQDASIVVLRNNIADVSGRVYDNEVSIGTLNDLIQNLDSSMDLYVLKSGDTMTGPLTINAGGLNVAGDISTSSGGNLYIDGNANIKGNLMINGSLYVVDVETIDVSSSYIKLNTGLTGAPPSILQSGIIVGRGSSDPYAFIYDESQQTFRIGIAKETSTGFADASTQAVATRQDNPLANGIAYWNENLYRFDTCTGFTISYVNGKIVALDASVVQLRTDIADVSARLSTFSPTDLSTRLGAAEASINRLDGSVNYLFAWDLAKDASIVALRAKDASQDASIAALDVLTQKHDISIGYLTNYVIELSTNSSNWKPYVDGSLAERDASIARIVLWQVSQDASIERIDASLNDTIEITSILDASLGDLFLGLEDVSSRVNTLEIWEVNTDASIDQLRIDIDDVSTRLANFSPTDLSTRIYNAETSIGALDVLTQIHDASIGGLETWVAAADTSINILETWVAAADTSINILETWVAAADISILQNATDINDVSIRLADISPADLSTRIYNAETSIGALDVLTQVHDISIGAINASLNDVIDLTTVIDASFSDLFTGLSDVSSRVYTLETWQTAADSSIGMLQTWVNAADTSINILETWVTAADTSIDLLWNQNLAQDASIDELRTAILDVSTDKISGVANINVAANASIYAYELDNIAYLKKIVAGSGATITEDTSTITIAVSGVSGFVSKYTSTFDGTANASIGISAVTHGLGVGPLTVTVYENTSQVYADVDCDANGNIVISWAPGSLGASCKYVIMG